MNLFADGKMNRESRLAWISLIILVGFVVAEVRNYVTGFYWGMPYPGGTFLFFPPEHFSDFRLIQEVCSDLNPYFTNNASGQLPFLNIVAYLFSWLPFEEALGLYSAILILPFFILCLMVFKEFSKQYVQNSLVLTLLNYPMLFTLDRGNFEGFLFTCMLAFVYFFWRGKFVLSCVFLGLAIAIKGFPAVFLPVFLFRKKYREAGIAMGLAVVLSVLSLAVFEGGFMKNLNFLLSGSNFDHPVFQMFLYQPNSAQRGTSLFTLFKVVTSYLGVSADIDYREALGIYRAAATLAYLPILWLAYRVRHEFWKIIAILTIAALLLPHLSGHYKLIHLLFVILLFIVKERSSPFDWAYAICLGLLMIPKPYFFLEKFTSDAPGHDLSVAMVVDPLLLLALLVLFCIEKPMRISTT